MRHGNVYAEPRRALLREPRSFTFLVIRQTFSRFLSVFIVPHKRNLYITLVGKAQGTMALSGVMQSRAQKLARLSPLRLNGEVWRDDPDNSHCAAYGA